MTSNARSPRRTTGGRALFAFAVAAVAAGVWLTIVAIGGGEPDEIVLDVDPAIAASVPSTVAPLVTADVDAGTSRGAAGDTAPRSEATDGPIDGATDIATDQPTEHTTDLSIGGAGDGSDRKRADGQPTRAASAAPRSPLGDLVGERGSAIPPSIVPRARPVALAIEALDLYGPVRAVGLEDDGQMEIPDETEIGWYEYGAAPGQPGATVVAAHVSWNGTVGPFHRLGELDPGDRVIVGIDDGRNRTYEVVERTMYDKDSLPRDRIWRTTGDESLVLITCGGSFNPEIRRYRQNIVVYAVPVG